MNYYDNQTYYDILGVEKTASFESIEKAKYRLKFGNSDDRVPFSMWNKIDEAYNVLHDPDKRREYDKYLDEKDIYSNSGISTTPTNDDNSSKTDENEADKEPSKEENPKDDNTKNPELPKTGENEADKEPSKEENPENDNSSKTENSSDDSKEEEKEEESKPELPNDDISEFITPFDEKSTKSNPGKLATGQKIATGAIGFALGGVVGIPAAIMLRNYLRKHKKLKLDKKSKHKKITKVKTPESRIMDEYEQNISREIDVLLSEPHNNYKLAINKLKCEKQIELLQKQLEHKLSSKSKKKVIDKLGIVSTKMQLEDFKSKLSNIEGKIEKYDSKQKLTKLNEELVDINKELSEQKSEQKVSNFKMKNLNKKQSSLLTRRNNKALKVKNGLVRSHAILNGTIKAKSFVRSLGYIPKSYEEASEFATKVR